MSKAEILRPNGTVTFTVYGSPIAQPRQRHAMRGKGEGAHVVNYTPSKHPVQQWKYNIAMRAKQENPRLALLTGPLFARITVFFPRPKKFNARKYSAGPLPHTCKPDRDNVEKAILDALKGVVFRDDCQVCAGEVMKFYHELNGRPRAEIVIGELP